MDFNPFKLQEDIYQRESGIDVSVFKNAIMSREDYFKDGNKCSKYTVSPTINGELYMYIEGISEYTQGLAIEVNGEFISSYGNSSSMQILNLGTFKAKDTFTVDGNNTKSQIKYDSIIYIPIDSEAQNHYIDMKYTKAGFNLGLVISIITVGVVLLLLLRNITVTEEKETL